MPPTIENAITSPLGMFLVLIVCALFWAFLFCSIARRVLLPAVCRFLARVQQEQQQQQQQELERRRRLHARLQQTRRQAMAAAAAQRLQEDREWREWMAERDRRITTAVQAQEPATATRQGSEYTALLRRQLEEDLARLDAIDETNGE